MSASLRRKVVACALAFLISVNAAAPAFAASIDGMGHGSAGSAPRRGPTPGVGVDGHRPPVPPASSVVPENRDIRVQKAPPPLEGAPASPAHTEPPKHPSSPQALEGLVSAAQDDPSVGNAQPTDLSQKGQAGRTFDRNLSPAQDSVSANAAPSRKLSENERAELKRWGNHREDSWGTLANPPRGRVSPEVRQAQAYIAAMMEKLAGPRLRARNVDLLVTIYTDDRLNAFMSARLDADKKDKDSKPPYPELPTIRRLSGASEDGRPVYEMGITAGMLRSLSQESELAFVLGHELTHFFEGHTKPQDLGETWYSSQRHEVIADHESLNMMLGKYDLEGALIALNRFPDNGKKEDQFYTGVKAGVQTHHHEGVRYALLQAQIENLRRGKPAAQLRDTTLLPEFLKLRERARLKPHYSQPSGERFADLIRSELERIDKSEAAPAAKVNEFLLQLMEDRVIVNHVARSYWHYFTERDIAAIAHFFAKNTYATNGWTADSFTKLIAATPDLRDGLSRLFGESSKFGLTIKNLYRPGGDWQKFVDEIPRLYSSESAGKWDYHNFFIILEFLNMDMISPSLRQEMERAALRFVASVNPEDLMKDIEVKHGSYPALFQMTGGHYIDDQKYKDKLFSAAGPHIQALARWTDSFLAQENYTMRGTHQFIQLIEKILEYRSFSAEYLEKLQAPLLRFITAMNHKELYPGYVPEGDINLMKMLGRMIASPGVSEQGKWEILKYLGLLNEHSVTMTGYLSSLPESLRTSKDNKPSTLTEFLSHIQNWPKEKFLEFLEERHQGAKNVLRPAFQELKARTYPEYHPKTIIGASASAQLFILNLAGSDKTFSEKYGSRFNLAELDRMLRAIGSVRRQRKKMTILFEHDDRYLDPLRLHPEGSLFLLDILAKNTNDNVPLAGWHALYKQIIELNSMGLDTRPGFKPLFEAYLAGQFAGLTTSEIYDWLKKPEILEPLSAGAVSRYLVKYVNEEIPKSPHDAAPLGALVKKITAEMELEEKHPDILRVFRQELAEARNLQPSTLGLVFPTSEKNLSEATEEFSGAIRALSAMVAATRGRPVPEELHMIDYLMGRRADAPSFIAEYESRGQRTFPLPNLARELRERLSRDSIVMRALVADSFLAGPSGFMQKPEGREALLTHLLKGVSDNNRELAFELARGLLDGEGRSQSLAAAYIFAQRSENGPSQALSEGQILRNLFDAYGVPGKKFGQYLAFSNELKDYRQDLESLQDAGSDIGYYEIIRQISSRFGDGWPSSYRINKILGSGSVNVAVEYSDLKSDKNEAAVFALENIETTTKNDFRRFNAVLKSLTATDAGRKRYGFLLGLSPVIEQSVALEFDKEHVLEMQKAVQGLYHREIDGWHIRTVDAFHEAQGTLFMEKAQGETARVVFNSSPEAYKGAMRALSRLEMGLLLGVDEQGRPLSGPLHANPDFHDGQVLIDVKTKTATILDFGQAVAITPAERIIAIDVLRVIAGAESPESAARIINGIFNQLKGPATLVTAADLAPILSKTERMDRFVHLLSLLSRKDFDLPISVAHWILAVNRQIVLGAKIGTEPEITIRNLIMARKLGKEPGIYSTSRIFFEIAKAKMAQLVGLLAVRDARQPF